MREATVLRAPSTCLRPSSRLSMMRRSDVRLLLSIAASLLLIGPALCGATCYDEASSSVATYSRRHKIYEVVEGRINVEDQVTLSRTNSAATACFEISTIHNNLHLCWLSGEARKVRANQYFYKDANCEVTLEIQGDVLRLRVRDPEDRKRTWCNPSDTADMACGANTGIDSGNFRMVRK